MNRVPGSALFAILLLAEIFGASELSTAQKFSHIIIVIQENRTTDNLFGASQLPGANLQIGAKGKGIALKGGPDIGHSQGIFLSEEGGNYLTTAYDYVSSGAEPYWQMAAQYGFANSMFQTNEGSSYPAHQFLISGTSAISDTSDLLVSGDPTAGGAGCQAARNSVVPTLAPNGETGTIFPCFTRSSLIDRLAGAGLSWRYYGVKGETFWLGLNSLEAYYKSPNIVYSPPQILKDIANGTLANVVWVTPAQAYSDHPGGNTGGGPAWVASIVNAVGKSAYWPNTAILVTWDDWGGWWDHVAPLANNTGWCMNYCYGFRVPLLVISAQTPAGYVDNEVHDFGSILHFVEANFGLANIGPGGWADHWADDLSGFFPAGVARPFVKVDARPLTKEELADEGEADND